MIFILAFIQKAFLYYPSSTITVMSSSYSVFSSSVKGMTEFWRAYSAFGFLQKSFTFLISRAYFF